jgi:hypothetical protein
LSSSHVGETPLFICEDGCAGARIARLLGVDLPRTSPLYEASIKRREAALRKRGRKPAAALALAGRSEIAAFLEYETGARL